MHSTQFAIVILQKTQVLLFVTLSSLDHTAGAFISNFTQSFLLFIIYI